MFIIKHNTVLPRISHCLDKITVRSTANIITNLYSQDIYRLSRHSINGQAFSGILQMLEQFIDFLGVLLINTHSHIHISNGSLKLLVHVLITSSIIPQIVEYFYSTIYGMIIHTVFAAVCVSINPVRKAQGIYKSWVFYKLLSWPFYRDCP